MPDERIAHIPGPVDDLSKPSGKPSISSAIRRVASGVSSEGLRITALPAARAGATFQAASKSGKFQGTMQATVPMGSFMTRASCWGSIGAGDSR